MDNEWKRGRVLVERIMFFLVDICVMWSATRFIAQRVLVPQLFLSTLDSSFDWLYY
jgi:hypothetical protein